MTAYKANQRLSKDLARVMRDTQHLLNATAGAAGNKVGAARARLANAWASTRIACGQLQDKTARAAKSTDRVIREHPYESLGIALGTGLLVGALVARK